MQPDVVDRATRRRAPLRQVRRLPRLHRRALRRRSVDVQHPVGGQLGQGRRPVGGVVELGADPADRPVRLRRQQDGHQTHGEVHRAVGQPQPDRHGHQRDRDGGQQLEGGGREERGPQGGRRGHPVPVADLPHHADLVVRAAVGHQRGQPPDHVEEVAAELGHRPPASLGLLLGVLAHERGEDRQQRQGEHDDERAPHVHHGQHDHGQRRHDRGGDERRQVAGDVGLEGRHPVGGPRQRHVGRRTLLLGAGRPAAQHGEPHLAGHALPGPARHILPGPAQQAAEGQQPHQAREDRADRAAADHPRDEQRQHDRLRDRGDAAEHAEDREHRHRSARGGERLQQAGVEGAGPGGPAPGVAPAAHRSPASAARVSSVAAAGCTSVGMWWPEIRLRKVQ